MEKYARSLLLLILCSFLFTACKGHEDPAYYNKTTDAVSSFEAESTEESMSASEEETESSQEQIPETIVQEIFYYPYIATDAGDIERHSEHGFRGYGECLEAEFVDEGQWNAYIVYSWGREDYSKPVSPYIGKDMATWMEELGLTVVDDYPYCAYYVETNGAPKGYTADQLSVYADCVVAAPESKMTELFGEGSAAVHGRWLRILPAMDPTLPYPEWYDPNKTYYYRGKRIFE